MKTYYEQHGIGKAKYTVSHCDGEKTHPDGSPFFDIAIFRNKKALQTFIQGLAGEGYREQSFAQATKALVTRIECRKGEALTGVEEARRGRLIARWLGLARCDQDRWGTPIGSKTDVGLFRTVKRLVEEGK